MSEDTAASAVADEAAAGAAAGEAVEPLTPERVTQLRADLKKLNSTATRLKLDLHDLAEDLPIGWERIMDVATLTYSAYSSIARIQAELSTEVSS